MPSIGLEFCWTDPSGLGEVLGRYISRLSKTLQTGLRLDSSREFPARRVWQETSP